MIDSRLRASPRHGRTKRIASLFSLTFCQHDWSGDIHRNCKKKVIPFGIILHKIFRSSPPYSKKSTGKIIEIDHFTGFRTNVPLLYSSNATRSSSFVFITIGPYHATGSRIGFPDTSRNRTGSPSVETIT